MKSIQSLTGKWQFQQAGTNEWLPATIPGGVWIWAAVLMAGFVRDAFMAIFMTMVIEVDGVGPVYAGTATGFAMAISGLGSFIAPPLGNSLAVLWPGAPFILWAGLTVLGMACLSLVKERSTNVPSLVLESAL